MRTGIGARLALPAAWLMTLVLAAMLWCPPAAATTARGTATTCPARAVVEPGHAPVLAHFYIWFTSSSWNRAKKDYPLAGRYSSDQASVVRQQVQEAKSAGISGFIVSWKSSPVLDARLATLARIAAVENFRLAITYEAQDFNKKPLPATQVRNDLTQLARLYGHNPVFQLLGDRPAVAVSGTWNYSTRELQSITAPLRSQLILLATERNAKGYDRVAPMFDGDLYYWSSADPARTPGYADKLIGMGNSIHAKCGLWVAPVAPGFDARAIGGHTVVDRRQGRTLRTSWQAANASGPDALGVISWNEFSENTYLEPSRVLGTVALDTLRALTRAAPIPSKELDSSEPQGRGSSTRGLLVLSVLVASLLGVAVVARARQRRDTPPRRTHAGRFRPSSGGGA